MFESICNMIYNFIFYTPNDEVETRRIIKYPDPNVTYPTLIFEEKYFNNHRNIKLYYQTILNLIFGDCIKQHLVLDPNQIIRVYNLTPVLFREKVGQHDIK